MDEAPCKLTAPIAAGIIIAGIVLFVIHEAYNEYKMRRVATALITGLEQSAQEIDKEIQKIQQTAVPRKRAPEILSAAEQSRRARIIADDDRRAQKGQASQTTLECMVDGVRTFDNTGNVCKELR